MCFPGSRLRKRGEFEIGATLSDMLELKVHSRFHPELKADFFPGLTLEKAETLLAKTEIEVILA